MATAPPPRRKGRVLLVAAAVTVVLAVAGTAVAVLDNSGDAEADARPTPTAPMATASTSARTDADRSSSPEPTDGDDKKTPSAKETSGDDGGSKPTSRASESATANSSGGGTSGGDGSSGGSGSGGSGSGDDGTTGDDGAGTPAPACTAIGGGKYNCTVWKTATSYTAAGAEAGVLNAGTNYFYCQSNLGRRETSGQWTNVWWAKTDDDSGNTGVYVSDVYLKGGNNDEPVPGLPVC
jgi:hypothetical protein